MAKSTPPESHKGLDFGIPPRFMVVPDISFNQQLVEGKIFAAAYMYREGYMPSLALVGQHEEPLKKAFEAFKRWGGGIDDDVVDIDIALWSDGSYDLAISPNIARLQYRSLPTLPADLPMLMSLSWIKHFDTTNPMLRQIADYQRSAFAPLVIEAATIGGRPVPESHRPDAGEITMIADFPSLIKFNMRIFEEAAMPSDSILSRVRDRGNMQGDHGQDSPKKPPLPSIQEVRKNRIKTLDLAFPVTRQRLKKKSFVSALKTDPEFSAVEESQVYQAGVNLILSQELCEGREHYVTLGDGHDEHVWQRLLERIEIADGHDTSSVVSVEALKVQLRLDIQYLTEALGGSHSGYDFSQCQSNFQGMS